ncbi:multicopper oxidase family protein [Sandaracinobacteroides saxicola]|uniref:Multicopper oxidase family protein n=1 Tax=Sandaracinobacteroides saxicola TaxID=2759707 RepID=A0A7G5IDZ6_9SPHN|nr:multicopper oxidase family protein [Sandaracinobacteroides saxicola]QMW21588.1 multicopper oxidase family protein [Sandaracinobacteroides saxicola]
MVAITFRKILLATLMSSWWPKRGTIFLALCGLASLPAAALAEVGAPLRTPVTYSSKDGVLAVTLIAAETPVAIGERIIDGATYNGDYGGPILRLKPGDVLELTLVNRLPQATNMHFHGLAVSPRGHGDDAMHMILPGQSWTFRIPIPADHAPGVYWFHTHGHEFAERQVMGGLSGTLVIEGFQDQVPATRPLQERLMALKEFSPAPDGRLNNVPKPAHGELKTINGQLAPVIAMQAGETQLWRLSGQAADGYFRLAAPGISFVEIGRDSRPLPKPLPVREIIIGPANRVDVLATASSPGRFAFEQKVTDTGPAGDWFPPQLMATIDVAPPTGSAPAIADPAGVATAQQQPIPASAVGNRRLIVFSEDKTTGLFFINHQTFDMSRIDVRVPLGSTEEWTVRNSSNELHIFHIHQVAFQVVSINGRPVPFEGLRDTVTVPIHGEVVVRLAFTDPRIVGRFMFHCHILEHEDKGMMATIEVYDPDAVAPPPATMPPDMPGMAHDHAAAVESPAPPPAPLAQNGAPGTTNGNRRQAERIARGEMAAEMPSMSSGAFPKFTLDTLANFEASGLSPRSGPSRPLQPYLRFDTVIALETSPDISLFGLLQFKAREPRPLDDPNAELFINQGAGRRVGGKFKELYARIGSWRVGKFVQNFGRAYWLLPGPFSADFVEEPDQGYEPSEMLGVERIQVFPSERFGWHQLTASAFMVDRTPLHHSWPFDEGRIRYADGGVGNTRLPTNLMLTWDAINVPVTGDVQASFQASVIRYGRSFGAERGERWATLGGDITIPIDNSAERTLDGRYAQLRLYFEATRRWNFEGREDAERGYFTQAVEGIYGPWQLAISATQRRTTAPTEPERHDRYATATLSYTFRAQRTLQFSIAHQTVGERAGTYAGLRLVQTITICSRCSRSSAF